jgi:hypothetical protein
MEEMNNEEMKLRRIGLAYSWKAATDWHASLLIVIPDIAIPDSVRKLVTTDSAFPAPQDFSGRVQSQGGDSGLFQENLAASVHREAAQHASNRAGQPQFAGRIKK